MQTKAVIGLENDRVFGSAESCDVTITDGSLSPQHFRVYEQNEKYFVVDINSGSETNVSSPGSGFSMQTTLNPYVPRELNDQDEITAGKRKFRFQL